MSYDEESTDLCGNPGYSVIKIATNPVYKIHIGDTLTDAARYRWLKEHMTVVLCEGKTTECYSKYMLPRLMAESRSGEKYTLDEIIDIKMRGVGI